MAIEPKYEKVIASERAKAGVTQAVIECRLPIENSSEVRKILCANAKSFIVSFESLNQEVNFNGNVNFQVIYEDAEGMAVGLDYTADFKDKFVSDNISESATAIVQSNVVDINTSISSNEIKITAITEISVEVIKSTEINALVAVNGSDVFTNTTVLNASKFDGVLTDKFDMTYDIEIKDNVLKVLEVTCWPYIEGVAPQDKHVKIIGGSNINICYITRGDKNLVRTHQEKVTFEQEVAMDLVSANTVVQSILDVNNALIRVTTNIDNDFAIINLNLPFDYKGYAFNSNSIEVIDDIFSISTYLTVNAESLNSFARGGSLNLESKVLGNVEAQDRDVDEILGTCCNAVAIATTFIEEDNFVLEGVASTTVLYLNKEEGNTYSMVVDMPFSIKENVADVNSDFTPVVNMSLGEVGAKVKRGKDIEVSATLFVYADFYSAKPEIIISEASEQEEKPENNSVLTIYMVKPNETVWEIAKQLNINPDCLLEQNPQVNLPLLGGEKLIVYRQNEVLF